MIWQWVTHSGEGNGSPLQYSSLENPMDGGAWWAAVHGVTRSRTRLSDFTFSFHFHALEKEMATHSSVLAWRVPGTEESGRLPSMGSHRVGHDWSDLAATTHRILVWLLFLSDQCVFSGMQVWERVYLFSYGRVLSLLWQWPSGAWHCFILVPFLLYSFTKHVET